METPASISERLAQFVRRTPADAIPGRVMDRAKELVLDALGIALASTTHDFARTTLAAMKEISEGGDSVVIGMTTRLSMRDAALVNGVLVHGLDFDDTHSGGIVHATASVLPAILAAGARHRASGRDALAAYVLGIEAAARLGAVAKGAFHQAGFHPTGLIGTFACALASGRLMALGENALANAQGLALSLASGSLEFLEDGAWNKRLHPGWAAAAGVVAAQLARHGFVGATRAYEGRFGLYSSYLQGRYDPADLPLATRGLGQDWELMNVALKPYPACHFVHACIEAAIALARELDAKRIAHVTARVPEGVVSTVCEPLASKRRPKNSYDAQFSIPFAVATALRRGRFGLAELEAEALMDEETLALAARVGYETDPTSTFPQHYTGELMVTTSDGESLRHRVAINFGNAERPLDRETIREKFHANARRAVPPRRAQSIETLALLLDRLDEVNQLADALAAVAA